MMKEKNALSRKVDKAWKDLKLFRAPPEEVEIIKEVLDAEAMEAGAIDAAEADELEWMGEELARKLGGAFC